MRVLDPPPASPATVPQGAPSRRPGLLVEVARILLTLVIAASVAFLIVKPELQRANDTQENLVKALQEAVLTASSETDVARSVADAIEPMVPPDNTKLFTILSKGVGFTEYEFSGSFPVAATPTAAFATDLISAQRTDAWTQEVTFHDVDANNNLCWRPIPWSSAGGSTCDLKCIASGITCTGSASTDGFLLSPGQAITRRFDGTSCFCLMGSANPTEAQTERDVR